MVPNAFRDRPVKLRLPKLQTIGYPKHYKDIDEVADGVIEAGPQQL
jgi:hypothetical protein